MSGGIREGAGRKAARIDPGELEKLLTEKRSTAMPTALSTEIQIWSIDNLIGYARNPRKNNGLRCIT